MAYYKHIYRVEKYTYDCIFGLLATPLWEHLFYFSVLSLSLLSDVEEYKYKI